MGIELDHTQLIVFDLDGTLVDAFDDITSAVNFALSEMGLPPRTTRDVRKYVGNGARRLMERVLNDIGEKVTDAGLDRSVALWRDYSLEHPVDKARLYPGAEAALDRLRTLSIKTALLSNKIHEVTLGVLKTLGIEDRFDLVLGEGGRFPRKPAPDALLHIMQQLGAEPRRTWMVGDGEADVLAGRVAGCKVCGVTSGLLNADELVRLGADKVIDSLNDLVKKGD